MGGELLDLHSIDDQFARADNAMAVEFFVEK